jgi:MoxR-like ATPase
MERPGKTPNFQEISQRRKEIRKSLGSENLAAVIKRVQQAELAHTYEEASGFKGAVDEAGGGYTKAKEILESHRQQGAENKAAFSRGIDEVKIRAELGDQYDILTSLSGELADLSDFEIRRLRETQGDPYARRMQGNLLEQIKAEKKSLSEKLTTEEMKDPTTARAVELVQLREGLFEEGHIAHTASVEGYLSEIGTRMIHGKPMFIHGPTGTGKTSLARYAAKHFTGKNAEMVYCTPQTRESQIWGKTGIRPTGEEGAIETIEIFGPLTRGMRDGSVVVFDEFTALPREQMVFLKGVANAKHGDSISVPGNGEIAIAPGFQMIFTANLKSDKNPERQELPPEIAREFEQNNLEVRYTPKEEAYDIMLARLMRPDGSLTLSPYDMNVTLPKLCEAMEEIQIAYADAVRAETAQLTGTMDAAGRKPALKKFVVTQGTVEAILESWETEKQLHESISFAEYVDGRLATGLSFKEYPETDRKLAAKIFAAKGFLRTITPKDLDLPADTFNFDAARNARTESVTKLKEKSSNEVTLSLKELADLDPFNVRGRRMAEEAAEFLEGEDSLEGTATASDPEALKAGNEQFFDETLKSWYGNDAAKATQEAVVIEPGSQDYKALSKDIQAGEFGKYTLNPEMQGIDLENAKAFIPNLSQFNGKPIHEVMKYVADTYGNSHHIPGIEYWKWIIENPGKVPQSMKDGNYYYFPGSVLRDRGGRWSVPCSYWVGTEFNRSAYWISLEWGSNFRIVLLEK